MIDPKAFYAELRRNGAGFYCGVPDSLLKSLCNVIQNEADPKDHVIAANEGNAVAIAIGHHLATGEVPVVYLQNSGLGNTVNPVVSLADSRVYSVPMIIMVGWRGEPERQDEPQHLSQGEMTEAMIKCMGLPYSIISSETDYAEAISDAMVSAKSNSIPHVLLFRKGTFSDCALVKNADSNKMTRENAIKDVLRQLPDEAVVVSTTGKASREVFEYRAKMGTGHGRDFLTVGGMGHASSIAMGVSMADPARLVVCLDGDGALLMHMGAMAIIGASREMGSFIHVVLNNGAHESVGGHPTVASDLDIIAMARACGYDGAVSVADGDSLSAVLTQAMETGGKRLIEIDVSAGSRSDLGRPSTTPLQNKRDFMKTLGVE